MSRFPVLEGSSLSAQHYTIPADLEGRANLVFVAFLRRQQQVIDEWIERLGDVESKYPGLAVYEVPLLVRFPGPIRWWIDNGMRSGIPDPRTRSRTITVYTDRGRFLRQAGLADEQQIWTVLLDREGTIHWSHIGSHDDGAEQRLKAKADQLFGG